VLLGWLQRAYARLITTTTVVRGIPVNVVNTRPEIETGDVLGRLDQALDLIERYTPHYYRHLRRDFTAIAVKRYACRGAYASDSGTCIVELTFTVNPEFSVTQVAAAIVHEAMHARLHRLGFPLEMSDRARQERFCRRAEIELGRLAPDGEPVVQRALDILSAPDDEVAPEVDASLAAHRIAEADLRASKAPLWLRRAIARRRGLTLE
jgi:hypothetical protein